jgi:hypothetical protein
MIRPHEVVEFGNNFINHSKTFRDRFSPVWEELYSNYRVQPYYGGDASGELGIGPYSNYGDTMSGRNVLKDPESHQIVEALLAQVMLSCFAPPGFITADPIGREDTRAGKTVANLIKYGCMRPGHYEAIYTILKDMFVFGTGIYQLPWDTVQRKALQMQSDGSVKPGIRTVKDDPALMPLSLYDFYPDPSANSIRDMTCVGKHFKMTAARARILAARNVFDKDVVERAIEVGRVREDSREDDTIQSIDGLSSSDLSYAPDYKMIEGYDIWTTDIPWDPSDGFTSRVITLFNDVQEKPARNAPSPFTDGELPFGEFKSNPVGSRFYGLSPLETNRFLQDHADILLMSRTDAVMQETKGSWKVINGLVEDPNKLRRGNTGEVHYMDDKDAILPLEFNHTLQHAYMESQSQKIAMRQASGASDPVQGINSAGSATATEIGVQAQRSLSRIELTCQLIEREYLSRMGFLLHSRFAQFLDNEGIVRRVGESPAPAMRDEIQGDFNFNFVGSRQTGGQQQKTAALREAITVLGSIPFLSSQVNWNSLIAKYMEDGLQIKDFEDFIASPEQLSQNVDLQTALANQQQASVGNPQQQPQADGRGASQVGGPLA